MTEITAEIKVFENPEFGVIRTTEKDGEPWFVGKDVADTLGYQNGSREINRHVDDEDRHKVMLFDGKQQAIWLTACRLHVLLNNRKESKNEKNFNTHSLKYCLSNFNLCADC